jgi:hypothetical protein
VAAESDTTMKIWLRLLWYNAVKRHWNDWRWYWRSGYWIKSGRMTREQIEWARRRMEELRL